MSCPHDGYTEYHETAGWHFLYRPLLRHQRADLRRLRDLPDDLLRAFIVRILSEQVVAADWDDVGELPDEVFLEVFAVVTGTGRDEQEKSDEQNLQNGVRLAKEYPLLARTSCEQCRYWWYVPTQQRVVRRDGQPLQRPPGGLLLCESGGCPKGHYSDPAELSAKNLAAWQYWQAEGDGPDAITRRNARIIRDAGQAAKADG